MPTALPLWGFAYCLGVFFGEGIGARWEAARSGVLVGAIAVAVAIGLRRWPGLALLGLTISVGVAAQARRPAAIDPLVLQAALGARDGVGAADRSGSLAGARGVQRASDLVEPLLGAGPIAAAPVPIADGTLVLVAIHEIGRATAAPTLWPVAPAFVVHLVVRGEPREPLRPGDWVRLRASLHPPIGRRNPGAIDLQRLAAGREIAAYASVIPEALVPWPSGPVHPRRASLAATIAGAGRPLWRAIAALQDRLHHAILQRRPEATDPPAAARRAHERSALLLALVLGERGMLQQIDRAREQHGEPTIEGGFRAAGIAHVLSVSGLHLIVATWLCFVALARGLRRIPWLVQRWEARRLAALAALPIAVLYTALTGAALPTVRALGAAGIGLLAVCLGRRAPPAESLAAAALWLVLPLPWPLPWAWPVHADGQALLCFEPSLQLSVAATWGLAFLRPLGGLPGGWLARPEPGGAALARGLAVLRRTLWRLSEGTLAAMLVTLPLCALYFASVQGATLLGNLLIVPIIELGVLPIGLLGAITAAVHPAVGAPLLTLAAIGAEKASGLAAILARLGWEVPVPAPGALVLALWAIGLIVMLRRRVPGWVLLGASAALLFLIAWCERGRLVLTALDVGQGDGLVIELPRGGVMVVDAGLRAGGADAGSSVVAPFLRRRGHRRIEVVVASHPHPDHIGGLLSLLNQFEVGELWAAPGWQEPQAGRAEPLWAELLALAARRGVRVTAPRTGLLGGVEISALGPCLDVTAPDAPCRLGAPPGLGYNDASIVLGLRFAGRTLVLSGDIERAGEQSLIDRARASGAAHGVPGDSGLLRPPPLSPPIDVLKAPHHCSRTSSSAELIELLRPATVICSVGRGNRYGFPHPEVVERYQASGATVLRTDRDGAVQITVLPTGALEVTRTAPLTMNTRGTHAPTFRLQPIRGPG